MVQKGKHFVGLKNQGATCYLNTLLQTWFMTQEVKECIASCKEEDSLICELRCLFERLSDGNERSLSTEQLTSQLNLSVYIQRDIEECFRSLVNKLSSKMDQDHKILKIYQVTMVSSLKCLKCTQSMEEDTFFLDIPLFVCSANAAEKFDLMEKSLEQFLKEEKMEGDNKCYCNICDMKTETTSRYYFKHLPQILTFQLKRFEFDYNNMAFQKITGCITFPPVLEFTRSQDARNEWCRKLTVNRVNNVDVVKGKEIPAQPQEVKQECSVDITAGNPETPQDCSQQVSTGQELPSRWNPPRPDQFSKSERKGMNCLQFGTTEEDMEVATIMLKSNQTLVTGTILMMKMLKRSETAYMLMYRLIDTNPKAEARLDDRRREDAKMRRGGGKRRTMQRRGMVEASGSERRRRS
ncbi:ubiquitin carboxyl-terminal hydrolase 47-like isoform X2 [Mobula birostris]|uniref:ubiquitin carboxyl-terminal hydrolase 47-like isoform X2 n=1 Tax=Mobula birostris TaxID=1983395 RepID=UPI003B28B128